MIHIAPADTDEAIHHVITLAGEYVTYMVTAAHEHFPEMDTAELSSAHAYDDLRQKFPGEHVPPYGRLYLARYNGEAGGCIALGKLSDTVCEMRTLFVRPEYRGTGMGRALVETTLDAAREIGYTHMRLDTLRFMHGALKLYRSLGFTDIAPYRDIAESLKPYICFLEVRL